MQAKKIGKIATINHNHVYYEYYKHPTAQETIILLHGFLSSSFSFRKLIPYLQKEFNLICMDLPPFGKSGKSKKYVYSYKNHALTVIQLIEKLNLGSFSLIGHSMGGQIALNIALIRPDLVNKIILLCSSAYLKKSKKSLILSSYIPFFHKYVKRYLEKSGLEKNLKSVVYDHKMIDKEMEEGYLAPFLEEGIFPALQRMIRDREGDLANEDLQKIHTPCLLIWGEHDKIVPLHIGKRLQNDLKNSKLIILKDTGHLVPEENPELVYNNISEFLNMTEKEPSI